MAGDGVSLGALPPVNQAPAKVLRRRQTKIASYEVSGYTRASATVRRASRISPNLERADRLAERVRLRRQNEHRRGLVEIDESGLKNNCSRVSQTILKPRAQKLLDLAHRIPRQVRDKLGNLNLASLCASASRTGRASKEAPGG